MWTERGRSEDAWTGRGRVDGGVECVDQARGRVDGARMRGRNGDVRTGRVDGAGACGRGVGCVHGARGLSGGAWTARVDGARAWGVWTRRVEGHGVWTDVWTGTRGCVGAWGVQTAVCKGRVNGYGVCVQNTDVWTKCVDETQDVCTGTGYGRARGRHVWTDA